MDNYPSGNKKGGPEVASIFNDVCSRKKYPVFFLLRQLARFGSCGSTHG